MSSPSPNWLGRVGGGRGVVVVIGAGGFGQQYNWCLSNRPQNFGMRPLRSSSSCFSHVS